MTGDTSASPTRSETPLDRKNCTLQPFLEKGQDAIATDAADKFAWVKLSLVDYRLPDALHVKITKTADDLFRAARKNTNPVPPGAKLIRAILDFIFPGALAPHAVEILPPSTVKLQHPEDAPRIIPFLVKHGFITTQKLASLLFILLTITGAIIPDLDDDDDDDPDDSKHRVHLPA